MVSVVVGNFWKTSILVEVTDIKMYSLIFKRMKEFCTGRDQVVLFNQQNRSGHAYCNAQQTPQNDNRTVIEIIDIFTKHGIYRSK